MGLSLRVQVQGQHGTPVDVATYARLVEEVLEKVNADGAVELQIRPVLVTRKSRKPGVYAVAYDAHVPYSIEVLLFGQEPTGRPGTLLAREESRVGAILEILSPRLHQSWQEAANRNFGIDRRHVNGKPEKLLRRGRARNSPADLLKASISQFRSYLKQDEGVIAYELVCRSLDQPLTQAEIFEICAANCAGEVMRVPVLHTLEQFGFIELSDEVLKNEDAAPKLTDYCIDLARSWIEEQNQRRIECWEQDQRKLVQAYTRAQATLNELEQRVCTQKEVVRTALEALSEYNRTSPDLISDL